MVGMVFLIVGVTVQIVTTDLGPLYFGRLMTGLANGFIMNFTFVYIAEMAPAHLRGVAYGLASGWVTLGAAIGYVSVEWFLRGSRANCRLHRPGHHQCDPGALEPSVVPDSSLYPLCHSSCHDRRPVLPARVAGKFFPLMRRCFVSNRVGPSGGFCSTEDPRRRSSRSPGSAQVLAIDIASLANMRK